MLPDDSRSFEVKVELHQSLVQRPLLFSMVLDVVTKEARSGLKGLQVNRRVQHS